MTRYRVETYDTRDGGATFGEARVLDGARWRLIARTKRFRTFPRGVRACEAAKAICKRHARASGTIATIERG